MGIRFWRFSALIMQRFLYLLLRRAGAAGLLWLCLSLAVQAGERSVLVLGDSISAAYGMSLEQGWVNLLARRLREAHPGTDVLNASISGETTAGALRRLPALLEQHTPALVVIELGGNDGLRGFPLGSLRSNLTRLVEQSQAAGARVVLLPMEIPPNYGARYSRGFRESYQQVAGETGSALAPFPLAGVATDPAMMQADGIHPTAAAQPVLLERVLPTIVAALEAR
jgi:acyl-CoA thioesterase-1